MADLNRIVDNNLSDYIAFWAISPVNSAISMRRLPALLTILFLLTRVHVLLGQNPLSADERDMVRYIHEHDDESLSLLETAVNINSGTMNFDGVRRVGDVFRVEMDKLGFESEWIPGESFSRSGHLFSRHVGDGPHLLLIGHLDTVFEPDSPFQSYKIVSDSSATGPGITDMKGGNVIIVGALKALKSIGALDKMTITVALLGDEESTGRPLDQSRAALQEAADEADIAIAFEDGDDNPATAVIARRGFTGWTLKVHGNPAHSSQVFKEEIGAGAIYEATRILNRFYEELSGERNLTFNPGIILGGTDVNLIQEQSRGTAFGKTNVIAEHVRVAGDLRTLSIEQRESAKRRMREIVADNLPRTEASIEFSDSSPPLSPTSGNIELLDILDQVSTDLGYGDVEAVDPGDAGAADISYTAGRVDMAIDGLGLMGEGGHTVNEKADLRTLPSQTARAAILFYRLALRDQAR